MKTFRAAPHSRRRSLFFRNYLPAAIFVFIFIVLERAELQPPRLFLHVGGKACKANEAKSNLFDFISLQYTILLFFANYKFGQTSRKFRQVQIKSFHKVFVARSIEIRITRLVT